MKQHCSLAASARRNAATQVRGFTAVELMVTLAVAAIFVAYALPNFETFVENSRRDSTVDDLIAALNYARTQALNLNQNTYVCPGTSTPTGTTCPGGSWSNGWEVIATVNGASTASALTSHSLSTTSTTPTVTAVYSSTALEFEGNGTAALTGNSGTGGVEILVVCDARGSSYARAVEINTAGYTQSSSQQGQAPDGTTLACTST
jgi:type IV fimbrial biogenesis protein FimT